MTSPRPLGDGERVGYGLVVVTTAVYAAIVLTGIVVAWWVRAAFRRG